jgi:hypothetical protein
MRRRRAFSLIAIAWLMAPPSVMADAGSPLMWAGAFHLLIGNALVGALEGALLVGVFRAEKRRWWLMIPANYVSMFAGVLLMAFLPFPGVTILNFRLFAAVWLLLFFGVTVLLEWPFGWLMLREGGHRLWRSLGAISAVNLASYAILILFYWLLSNASLLRETVRDQSLLAEQPGDEQVYFLSPDARRFCRIGLNGQGLVVLGDLPREISDPRLTAEMSSPGQWNLLAEDGRLSERRRLVAGGLMAQRMSSWWEGPPYEKWSDLRDETGPWQARCVHYDPFLRLTTPGGDRLLVVHTPMVTWGITALTNLPGDRAVFQLGDQIVLLEMPTMRMALLTRGLSPVVALGASDEKPG